MRYIWEKIAEPSLTGLYVKKASTTPRPQKNIKSMNAHYVRGTCRGWDGGEPYLLFMITMIWHTIYQVTHWKDSPGECQEPGFGQDVFVVYLMVPSVSNSIETNKNESNEHTIIPQLLCAQKVRNSRFTIHRT